MSEEINLTTLFTLVSKTIKRHWLLVLMLFAGGALSGFLSVSYLLPKKYVSQAVFRSTYLSAADIEMNMNHVNAVLLADTNLPNPYRPYAGCKNFTVKAEDKGNVPEEFLETFNTNVTVELETTLPSNVYKLAPAIKLYFDTNATYLGVKSKKHNALRDMVASLEQVNQDLEKSITAYKVEPEELLFLPNTYNEIASAKVILDEDHLIQIVQPFSPPKEKSNNAIAVAMVSGILFVILGFTVKGFIEA
jgi:hypothetical protein